ncbi:MAG: peptidyl-prolyl cis-trans isomerase [Candidatus Sumerlaeaceae bacterium]
MHLNVIGNCLPKRVLLACLIICPGNCVLHAATSPENPVLATFDGGELTLRETEVFARELPVSQRVPYAANSRQWRHFICRELGKCIIFTTPALALGRHHDPAYLRGREYFLQEYLDFVMLRDNLLNKIDVSREAQEREFKAHPEDFLITPTVTLRYIRTKSADVATSAAARIQGGEDFVAVEREISEVSPRYLGRVLGPFPNPKQHTAIPPPQEILNAALATPIGNTTGPLQVGPNYFIARTEAKTTGGLASFSDAGQALEARIRDREGERLLKELMSTLRKELAVQQDDALLQRKAGARWNDVIATVGATLVTRQEFEDLNGRVRGPAVQASQHERTRLGQFITPLILAEAARSRGYLNREETKQALYYWDLQHLSTWYIDSHAASRVKEPTDRELRQRFAAKFHEYKSENKKTTPTFEMYREGIAESMRLERRPVAENEVIESELRKRNWQVILKQPSQWITALEGLVHVADKIPGDARIVEISDAREHEVSGHNWFNTAGRHTQWRITYVNSSGASSELISEAPAMLSDGSAEFTSCPAYLPYATLWRFDTDSLFRHAVDRGMGDFGAKHNNRLRLSTRVEISYSEDVPTSPTDCLITYTATPADDAAKDGFVLKYSGITGEITQRRIGEPEGPCPTCPGPDLPAPEIIKAAQRDMTASQSNETSASVQAIK